MVLIRMASVWHATLTKPNIIAAVVIGVLLGLIVNLIVVLANRVPVLGCIVAPVGFVAALVLPVLVGALAAAWTGGRGWQTAPAGVLDGALAGGLVELAIRVITFCATVAGLFGPRSVLLGLQAPVQALFAGVWGIGWLVVSLVAAVLLGGLGGFLYNTFVRR